MRAKKPAGGYNIVTISDGIVTYEERNPVSNEQKQWAQSGLFNHHFTADTTHYFRPSYAVNETFKKVKTKWQNNDNSDIGSGVALSKNIVIASNSNGFIYALNKNTGKQIWSFASKGKIYPTPATEDGLVVVASTDDNIYCLNASSGKLVWKFETQKPIVANALIKNKTGYVGAGEGHFRILDLYNGNLKWDFDSVKGFVVTAPLL